MTLQDIKEISTAFFFYWYNVPGNNTETGFDGWLMIQEHKILDELDKLEPRYVKFKWSLAKKTNINPQLLTILLKKLRQEGVVMIMPICSESTGLASGSGYCLTKKNQ
tara:strand:- start:3115 stop:3438 length:324 start_codon:yes stop_codon:yes gene_type:complete